MSDAFSDAERAAVYLVRSANAATCARISSPTPCRRTFSRASSRGASCAVGLAQPRRFLVIRERATRATVHALFLAANHAAARAYDGERAARYRGLRLAGILDAPFGIAVFCDDAPAAKNLNTQT